MGVAGFFWGWVIPPVLLVIAWLIYDAIDEIEAALRGMLKPIYEEKAMGTAEIRQIFRSGATAYIVKPFTSHEIRNVMMTLENRKTAAGLHMAAAC